jgi:hypothetical protein
VTALEPISNDNALPIEITGFLMPAKKDQAPPDLRYFRTAAEGTNSARDRNCFESFAPF